MSTAMDTASSAPPRPPDALVVGRLIERARRRWFLSVWSLVAVKTGLVALGLLALAGAAVWLRPGDRLLVASALAVALGTTIGFAWFAWPLRRRPDDAHVARFVEEHCPELEDRLVSGVDMLAGGVVPSALSRLALDDAARAASAVDLDRVVSRAHLRRRAWAGGGVLLGLVAAMLLLSGPIVHLADLVRAQVFPSTLSIVVEPGHVRVREGEAVKVVARLSGRSPQAWSLPVSLHLEDGAGETVHQMAVDGALFAHEIDAVTDTVRYRVVTGDVSSPQYEVTVQPLPRVTRIDVAYAYPAFTGLEPRVQEDGGDIYAPAGTQVRLSVTTDGAVASGVARLGSGEQVTLDVGPTGLLEGGFTVSAEGTYRVGLFEADGHRADDASEYFIRIVDDRPPEVRVLRPGGDKRVTPLEEVGIEARADDDHGIARLDLVVNPPGRQPRVVPLHAGATGPSVTARSMLYLEDLEVAPGDVVSYYARARDVAQGKRSTEVHSDIFFLEVRPFGEEFSRAESQAFRGAGGSADRLAAEQKEIVVATWKIERRSRAGRSTDDIKAIARAQRDLRTRAQRAMAAPITATARRGPRQAQPGNPRPEPAAPSPIQRAVEAMDRAAERLDRLDVSGALPHEMEALNALLRAEAEVTRRQVAQQQSDGAGGNSTSGNEDLSALFDRELRRQQTNYESRASVEARQETREDEARRKLRELARRQDDMARAQQELARRASQMSAAEVKRQLERLTREQEELERRARQLADEMERQRGAGAERGGDTQQALASAEQAMRESAAALRRGEPGKAAEQTARAQAGLDAARRRLDGAGEAPRSGEALDAALEAQRLADGERRIAEAAERLARQGGSPGGWERLASDQARVAEEQAALDGHRPGQTARRLGESAAEMRALGRESRETADDPRGRRSEGGEARAATTARALARSMARAAEALGRDVGLGKEAQEATEQLARTRNARQRLEEISQEAARAASRAAGEAQGPSPGGEGPGGQGQGQGELDRLRAEFAREARSMPEFMDALERENPGLSRGLAMLEGSATSRSAPGTEAFKQDYARWEALQKGIVETLERVEASMAARLRAISARERVATGSADRVPEQYRRRVAGYFETIARVPPR